MKSRVVGYSNRTRYWQTYAFSNPPVNYDYARGYDTPFHLMKTNKQHLLNTKLFLPLPKFKLYHTYNAVVANRTPWVAEVESVLPRYGDLDKNSRIYKWAIHRMRSDYCKKIIFTSAQTFKNNRDDLLNQGVDSEKLAVTYRAVERYENLSDQSQTFNLLFAGNAFYRKGGIELLKAFSRINSADVRLTIISSFDIDWEVYPSQEQVMELESIIEKDSRIKVLSGLSHIDVIKEMRKAHVFIATTFADPFNNTVLEALACGVPVITSTTGAIPEFVTHGVNGFMINVKDCDLRDVVEFIHSKIQLLFSDSSLRKSLVKNAYEICKNKFDIKIRNEQLKIIYDNALKG